MNDDIVDDTPRAAFDQPPTSRSAPPSNGAPSKVVQPKPQALAKGASVSAILVSPRQKGNPILNNVRSVGWEYSDIPADFILGATTCALFLSLKYHRIHPEYIYSRIKALGNRYGLRILLVLVDIDNHESPLKELSKTSLINNVTVILCWSSAEGGRYLELYKNYEHAAPTSIKGIQSTTYSDQLVDFVTEPRGINKTDAVNLVSNFGSIRTAINARPEEIALIPGWGEKKVQRWCSAVREPFRARRAGRRGLMAEDSMGTPALSREPTRAGEDATPALSRDASRAETDRDAAVAARLGITEPLPFPSAPETTSNGTTDAEKRPDKRIADDYQAEEPGADEEEAFAEMMATEARMSKPKQTTDPTTNTTNTNQPSNNVISTNTASKRKNADDDLSEGVMAALSKLRKT
ncbi:hypothetical protein MBLNU457_5463t1 [Dothideomycetes sp. NU457]